MFPSFQVRVRRVLAQPRVGARDSVDDLLDLGAHVVVRLVGVPPHVVFDRAVVRRRPGVREQVEPAVRAASGAADDDPRRQRVVPGRQDRMRLRVRPSPLELLERDDELEHLLDRVHAAARLPACVNREVARRGMSLLALDLDAEVHETTFCGAQPELGRLERDRHVARGRTLDDLAGAVPDNLLVADDVEDDVSVRFEAVLGAPPSSPTSPRRDRPSCPSPRARRGDRRRPRRRRAPATTSRGRRPVRRPRGR